MLPTVVKLNAPSEATLTEQKLQPLRIEPKLPHSTINEAVNHYATDASEGVLLCNANRKLRDAPDFHKRQVRREESWASSC